MSLDISWEGLASTAVAVARGVHEINPSNSYEEEEEGGGILQIIIDHSKRLIGWGAGKLAGFLRWSVSQVFGAFVAVKNFIWTFNVNASDEALDVQLRQQRIALASYFGSTLGCGFGWAAGMLFSAGIHAGIGAIAKSLGIPLLAFDKASMFAALKAATEEGIEEMGSLLGGLVRMATLYFLRHAGSEIFKSARRLIKWLNTNPKIRSILPSDLTRRIDEWGEANSEPWTLAQTVEDAVDNIQNEYLRSFLSAFLEEADECFIEGGYVYAANVDRIMSERADMREAVLGTQQVVEIVPDREAPNERIVLAGREQLTRATITQSLVTHQLVHNRDVGQIVGQPANEQMLQQAPVTTLTLRILYYPVPSPPFTATAMATAGIEGDWITCDLKIPFIDPIELDWSKIKKAAGLTGRMRGRYRCYGYLAGRKLEVYGSSEADSEQWLRDLATLSEAKDQLTGVGFTRRARNPASTNSLSDQFSTIRVYPAYAIVLSQRLAKDKTEGRATLQGNFTTQSQRIELWPETPPAYTKEILSAMKTYHTPLELLGIGFKRP